MKYYIAYGSNLNVNQMLLRCPGAIQIGSTVIPDYRLTFRGNYKRNGVANIEPCAGGSVPVGIWAITESDEVALDRYEGFPRLYVKQDFRITVSRNDLVAMAYIMTPGHPFTTPSKAYLDTIWQGYLDFDFDVEVLLDAVAESLEVSQ